VNRRNFLIDFSLWILSFIFGYNVGTLRANSAMMTDKGAVAEKIETLNKELTNTAEQLETTMKFPLAPYEIESEVIRRDLPYFHVERYGAVGDYDRDKKVGTDNTVAIQRAIDAAIRNEGGIIQFESKKYLIKGTIYINPTIGSIPIYLSGKSSSLWRGSMIYKENKGDFFKVNLKADDSSFLDPEKQFYNFGAEKLTLISETLASGNGFRMFRTRCTLTNMFCHGLNRFVYQPALDSAKNVNYCDMSEYKGITINYPRIGGLELNKPDGSKIERIYVHYPVKTCKSYILIRNGGGFNIANAVFAWHMNNDGVSYDDDSAYIKITGADGFTIDNIYVERTHLSNMIAIHNSKNWEIKSVYERFIGNNAFHISSCHTGDINGVYRNSSKYKGFCDIYFAGKSTNLTIRKFRIRDYETSKKRELDLQGKIPSDLKGETIQLGVYYNGSAWRVVDSLGNDVTDKFGIPIWSNNKGIQFPDMSIIRYSTVLSLYPRYAGDSMPFMPVFNDIDAKKITFYDQTTGKSAQKLSRKMNFVLTVSVPVAV